jgi:hypothetical protein
VLRGNLSTRPFYNERLVSLSLGLVAVVVLALTAFNVSQLVSLSGERSDLRARIARDDSEATRVNAEAAALQRTVSGGTLRILSGSTREANALIDERTFSWTGFFGLIEKTLPVDVRLVAVTPHADKGELRIEMLVVSRGRGDLDTFIDALLETGAFYDVIPKSEQINDDGTRGVALEAGYLPPPAPKASGASGAGERRP